jgi:hypothetical protein
MAPFTVTTIMENVDIKNTLGTARRKTATTRRYSRGPVTRKMKELLSLSVDELNERNIPLKQIAFCDKAKSLFVEL